MEVDIKCPNCGEDAGFSIEMEDYYDGIYEYGCSRCRETYGIEIKELLINK